MKCSSSRPLPATSSRLRHSARPRSSEDAKRELDSEVHELNRIVKQLRSSKSWLDEREQKISIFQALLESDVLHSDPRPEQSSSSTESSKVSYSSQGTGSISAQLHCLESIQQASLKTNYWPVFERSSAKHKKLYAFFLLTSLITTVSKAFASPNFRFLILHVGAGQRCF